MTRDQRYTGDVDPTNANARRAQPGPSVHVAKELCRRVETYKATLADIEEALDRGHYSMDKLRLIGLHAESIGGVGGSVVKEAALAVLEDEDMLKDRSPAELRAELFKYWR